MFLFLAFDIPKRSCFWSHKLSCSFQFCFNGLELEPIQNQTIRSIKVNSSIPFSKSVICYYRFGSYFVKNRFNPNHVHPYRKVQNYKIKKKRRENGGEGVIRILQMVILSKLDWLNRPFEDGYYLIFYPLDVGTGEEWNTRSWIRRVWASYLLTRIPNRNSK